MGDVRFRWLCAVTVGLTTTGALGQDPALARINCGGPDYTDTAGHVWSADFGFNTGNTYSTSSPIAGTSDPVLYQTERWDPPAAPELLYSLALEPGAYEVDLHLANIYPGTSNPGERVFDVLLEGQLVLDDYDIVADVGHLTAVVQTFVVDVLDGSLDIELLHVVENPKLSAIAVTPAVPLGTLNASPDTLVWGHVELNVPGGVQNITLDNPGPQDVTITSLDFVLLAGVGHDFHVTLDGVTYVGDHETISYPVDVPILAGASLVVPVDFIPTELAENTVSLEFTGNFPAAAVTLEGTGDSDTGDPFLHVVIGVAPVTVDVDLNGTEDVFLEGSFSHTHEPGRSIVSYEWSEGGVPFSTEADVTWPFAVGEHTVSLTIADDNDPPRTLTDSATFTVAPVDAVPGALALTYDAGAGSPADLLMNVPAVADRGDQLDGLMFEQAALSTNVMVRLLASLEVPSADTYTFQLTGGGGSVLLVNGAEVAGPLALGPGAHEVDARFVLNSPSELPLEVTLGQGGGPQQPIDPALLTHDLTAIAPVVNSMVPVEGSELGGNLVTLSGLGFFLETEVVVHWGPIALTAPDLQVTPSQITLNTPPGSGSVSVTVQTPRGVSNDHVFTYVPGGPLPIDFTLRDLATGIGNPTSIARGPDGRFYVATQAGDIHVLTVDDDYQLLATEVVTTISGLSNNNILGLSFNPFDPPDPVRLYVSHNQLFANGGSCFSGFSPYSGQVSVLESPGFDVVEPVLTGLPVSNHDHGINGTDFDNNGDLFVCVGGNTNAGVPACPIGDLPESPLSAAILRAEISRPDFNGAVTYQEIGTGTPNNDQVYGDIVEVVTGSDVSVYAPGLRNPYDLVFTTWGAFYATDNGPNAGYGPASTGPDTQGPDPSAPDELCLIEYYQYYGHPNRNRGLTDARQNIYRNDSEPSLPGEFTQALTTFTSSTNGILEFRSTVFNGAMLGELVAQRFNGATYRVTLSPDGRSVESQADLPVSLGSLDITDGPGGVILGVSHGANKVVIAEPVETIPGAGLRVYDIFPWRAPATGGHPFTIGGRNFGTLGDTTVLIDGTSAVLTSVSGTKIHGLIPARTNPSPDLLDVVVVSDGQQQVLVEAFRYLLAPGSEPSGWSIGPALPVALGEVASGVIDGVLYVVGEGHPATLAYDINAGAWSSPGELAARPFAGHHHAAEVINGKLYLFGGLHDGSPGQVQIYDPVTDSWSLGAPMPWAAGSCCAGVIGGMVYVAGGIVGNSTVTDTARYDPLTDAWSAPLADMIDGRNHAASATDGARLFVFGGRGPGSGDGNVVADGFDDVQIYDPATNTWASSNDPGSTLAPLPQGRGGTGRAVYTNGEFYVMGGETANGPGASPGNTYDRVDVYDPVTSTWRLASPMPMPMHGIYPVQWGRRLYLAGGGMTAGNAQSTNFMLFDLPFTMLGDANGDGRVDIADFLLVLGSWGPCAGCPADLNGDGEVNIVDVLTLLANWSQ